MKSVLTLVLLSALSGSAAFAADYKIDPDHSNVGFKVKHLAISSVSGRFTEFEGTFSFDPKNVSASRADAKIRVKSVNTEQRKRDDDLKGPGFFEEAKFPEMEFKTVKIEPVSDKEFNAVGDLTIHGISKPVTLNVVFDGAVKDPWGNERAAFTATTKINRKDFGLTYNKVLETGGLVVGEDVQISIDVEGIKKAQG